MDSVGKKRQTLADRLLNPVSKKKVLQDELTSILEENKSSSELMRELQGERSFQDVYGPRETGEEDLSGTQGIAPKIAAPVATNVATAVATSKPNNQGVATRVVTPVVTDGATAIASDIAPDIASNVAANIASSQPVYLSDAEMAVYMVLFRLDGQPTSSNLIGAALDINPASVRNIIPVLRKKGLIAETSGEKSSNKVVIGKSQGFSYKVITTRTVAISGKAVRTKEATKADIESLLLMSATKFFAPLHSNGSTLNFAADVASSIASNVATAFASPSPCSIVSSKKHLHTGEESQRQIAELRELLSGERYSFWTQGSGDHVSAEEIFSWTFDPLVQVKTIDGILRSMEYCAYDIEYCGKVVKETPKKLLYGALKKPGGYSLPKGFREWEVRQAEALERVAQERRAAVERIEKAQNELAEAAFKLEILEIMQDKESELYKSIIAELSPFILNLENRSPEMFRKSFMDAYRKILERQALQPAPLE